MAVWSEAPKGSLANLIQEGNRKAALAQIRAGADVNEAQPDGTRPIHWAVYRVDYELLDALIAKKAKVDVADRVRIHAARGSRQTGRRPDGKNAAGCRCAARCAQSGRRDPVDAGDQDRGAARRQNAGPGRRERQRQGNVSQPDGVDVGRHCAEKCRRDGKASSCERRRLQTSRPLQRLAQPDYVGASRAVSSGGRPHRIALRGARRLL